MIKWTGMRNGRPMIGLGLEERNLQMLRRDKPVLVKGEEIGIAFDILIYYGATMDALLEMTKSGIGPGTIIHDASKAPGGES